MLDLPADLDPTRVVELKRAFALLRKPRNYKKYGQNFLMDRDVRDQIISAADLTKSDTVLEVGPGSGVLTQQLVKQAARVVALDVDPYALELVKHVTGEPKHLELLLQDVRQINLPATFCPDGERGQYVVVSNPPYLLTGYLFRLLLESSCSPKRIVLTIQKEVADRVLAKPGGWSMLTVTVALFGKVQSIASVPSTAFWPKPKVSSTVIRIDRHAEPVIPPEKMREYLRIVRAGFSARRKKLRNALSGGLQLPIAEIDRLLEEAKISPDLRAQELLIEDWTRLSQIIAAPQTDRS